MNKEEKEAIEKIKILAIGDFITWFNTDGCIEMEISAKTILNLIQKQEKIIDAMSIEIYNYANLGMLKICPAEQDNGNYNLNLCKMNLAERNCILCIKEYFKKEVEENE